MPSPTEIFHAKLTEEGNEALDAALEFEGDYEEKETKQIDTNRAPISEVGTYVNSLNDWLGEGTGNSEVATMIRAKLELLMPDAESVPESARSGIVAVLDEIWTAYDLKPSYGKSAGGLIMEAESEPSEADEAKSGVNATNQGKEEAKQVDEDGETFEGN